MLLIKLSDPGWEKFFVSERDAKRELYKHICGLCVKQYGITDDSSVNDLLSTDCGCEFMVEV
jgi:hypothetical protein